MFGGILSGVWKPKPRASETAAMSVSAGSAVGDEGAVPVMSPTSLAAARSHKGGGGGGTGREMKGGAEEPGVSNSQPLGWMLSCVNAEGQGNGGRGGGREVRMKTCWALVFCVC